MIEIREQAITEELQKKIDSFDPIFVGFRLFSQLTIRIFLGSQV
jgi:hypothetical protein